MEVERKTDEMINYCRTQLLQKKQLIINDLNLTKRLLLQKVNINPKCWNIDSLELSLDVSYPSGIASLLKMNNVIHERLDAQQDVQQQIERDQKVARNLVRADMIARNENNSQNRKALNKIERRKRRELNLLSNLDSSESD